MEIYLSTASAASNFTTQLARLPDLLSAHVLLSIAALAAGAVISLPLGIFGQRWPKLQGVSLGGASVVQTIPALALLALMVPLVGQIGILPAFLALTLYAILPMLRGVVVGLGGVDPAAREAARAVGMTPGQSLRRVELPLAAPVILAGMRTATVWVVGAATLATLVGATSLGNYIISGLQTRNWIAVLFGCVFSAALALTLDRLLHTLEASVASRRRRRAIWSAGGFAALIAIALASALLPTSNVCRAPVMAEGSGEAGPLPLQGRQLTIGAKTFTEQYILACLISRRLEAAGAQVVIHEDLGSTVAFDAAMNNEVDLYIDYTGTVWATLMDETGTATRAEMSAAVTEWLSEEHGALNLGNLGFENAYALAVTRENADALRLESIADLARMAPVTIGADPEFFARPEWTMVRARYGLQSARERNMGSTFMYDALINDEVDAISAYTSDGRVAAYDLVLLDDPREALPPYDALIVLAPAVSEDQALIETLTPLMGAIPLELMQEANAMVDMYRAPTSAAAEYLDSAITHAGNE